MEQLWAPRNGVFHFYGHLSIVSDLDALEDIAERSRPDLPANYELAVGDQILPFTIAGLAAFAKSAVRHRRPSVLEPTRGFTTDTLKVGGAVSERLTRRTCRSSAEVLWGIVSN